MRALRTFRFAALALACAVAILAGDAVGQMECWLRRRAARRRLRRWKEIRTRRTVVEAMCRKERARQCQCECHLVREFCGPCCPTKEYPV